MEVAQGLWHSPHPKAKDYIVRPKANGYQSLHLTLTVATAAAAASAAAVDGAALRSALEEDEVLPSQQEGAVFLELQIRTQGGLSICGGLREGCCTCGAAQPVGVSVSWTADSYAGCALSQSHGRGCCRCELSSQRYFERCRFASGLTALS